jgi:integrase
MYLASVEVAKVKGEYIAPQRARLTLGEWIQEWAKSRADLKPSSRERLDGIIAREVVPKLGTTPLGELTHSRCQAWIADISVRASAATARKCAFVLSGALEAAVKDQRIVRNPAAGLHLPRVGKSRKRYLTVEQVRDLAAAVERHGAGKQNGGALGYGTLIRVLAYCGLRWSEVAGLRVKDLDAARRRLHVEHTMVQVGGSLEHSVPKDYEARSVPVPRSVVAELAELVVGRDPEEPLFAGARSRSWLPNRTFRRGWFDDAAGAVGLEGLTPHELRHTAASLAVCAGANVKAVQRMLGHASAAVTLDVYADLFDDDLDMVGTRLEALMAADRGDVIA